MLCKWISVKFRDKIRNTKYKYFTGDLWYENAIRSPAIVQERSALVQHRQVAAYLEVTYSESHTGYEMFVLNDIYSSVE